MNLTATVFNEKKCNESNEQMERAREELKKINLSFEMADASGQMLIQMSSFNEHLEAIAKAIKGHPS